MLFPFSPSKKPSPPPSRVRNWVACVFRSLCDEGQGHFAQPMMGCTRWKPSTGDGEIEIKKVMGAVWAENKDSLVAFQKNIEEAATSFSHTTKSTRQNEATTSPEEVFVQENSNGDRRAREKDHEVQKSGEKHFTEEKSVPEITIELVLQARAKMADNKVNGPEDSTVSEMIKQPPQEKKYEITRCFQDRSVELEEAQSSS